MRQDGPKSTTDTVNEATPSAHDRDKPVDDRGNESSSSKLLVDEDMVEKLAQVCYFLHWRLGKCCSATCVSLLSELGCNDWHVVSCGLNCFGEM